MSIHGNCIRDGREVFSFFPGGGQHRLYAVGFADGRVKLGYAYNVRKRVKHLWRDSRGSVAWAHCFGVVDADGKGYCPQEQAALSAASERGSRIGRSEYFTGLTREDAIAAGRHGFAAVTAAAAHKAAMKRKPAKVTA